MEYKLKTPLTEDTARKLKLGDVVWLTGTVFTMRDSAHVRAVEYLTKGLKLPVNLADGVVFHAGPICIEEGKRWKLVVVGPTSSPKLSKYIPELIRGYNLHCIVGKDGMDEEVLKAMKEHGTVYLAYPGGSATACSEGIEDVVEEHWLDLGVPEALWVFRARDWGPLTVAMDSHGGNIYRDVKEKIKEGLGEARKHLGITQEYYYTGETI